MNNDEIVKWLDKILKAEWPTLREVRKLRDKLKPKPEFLEGELVLMRNHSDTVWTKHFFGRHTTNVNTPYANENGEFYNRCKRIPKLPIHFSDWNGGKCPCDGLVTVKRRGKRQLGELIFTTGYGKNYNWTHNGDSMDIISYQPIEDLENEQ